MKSRWSTGKDSAWMLHVLNQQYPGAAAGLLTTTNEAFDRVAMHAVRRELLEAQAEAARPAAARRAAAVAVFERAVRIDHADGDRRIRRATASRTWPSAICFSRTCGAIARIASPASGLEPLFPIWKTKPTADLARDMIDGGLQARLTCVDPRKLDRSFAGRAFDHELLDDLPPGIDPCGENGEFHSFAFARPDVQPTRSTSRLGEVVDRDGFVFADLTLSS